MGHEYLACALVKLMQIGKTPSRSNAVPFSTRQKPSMGLRWCPQLGR